MAGIQQQLKWWTIYWSSTSKPEADKEESYIVYESVTELWWGAVGTKTLVTLREDGLDLSGDSEFDLYDHC